MTRGITVTGVGTATGARDRAVLDLGVEVTRPAAAAAMTDCAAAAAAVRAAVVRAGVAAGDLATGGVSLTPVHDPWPRVTAYTAALRTQVTVRDPDRAGELVTEAVAAGGDAARVYGITFTHEDPAELAVLAQQAAVADARAKAQRYAALAGVALGPVLHLEEAPQGRGVPVRAMKTAVEAAVPIDAGEGTVTVQVTMRWGLA